MHVKIDYSKHLSVPYNLHFLSWLFIFCRSSFYSKQTDLIPGEVQDKIININIVQFTGLHANTSL